MIKSNKGNVEIEGEGIDVLTDLSLVIYALISSGISEEIIRVIIDNAIEKVKKEKVKKDDKDIIKKIFKDLGIEV